MCGGGAARDGAWNLGAPRERGLDPGAHQGGGGVFPQSEDSEEEVDPGKGPGAGPGPGPGPGPRTGYAVQVLTQEHDPGLHQRDP